MRIDVSEVKTYKTCKRQWELTSRNKFHLRPLVTPPQFHTGTLFHEALALMYMDVPLEKIMHMVKREMVSDADAPLLAMVPGYYKNVLPGDMETYKPLVIEHKFNFIPTTPEGEVLFDPALAEHEFDAVDPIEICGSIDLVALHVEENAIYGFEHKTARNFRDDTYLWMDEQPRVYTEALKRFVQEYNDNLYQQWLDECATIDAGRAPGSGPSTLPEEPEPAKLGGIYINEVKKLLRQFQYKRTLCTYTDEDHDRFMQSFYAICARCKSDVDTNAYAAPSPSFFGCQMCSYSTVCATYMYEPINKEALLEEFAEEFHERTEDHLDEKDQFKLEDTAPSGS